MVMDPFPTPPVLSQFTVKELIWVLCEAPDSTPEETGAPAFVRTRTANGPKSSYFTVGVIVKRPWEAL
jgi:hypothetical protein